MENTIVLKVEGMTCGHCKMAVTRALSGIKGISKVNVDLNTRQAVVTMSENVPLDVMKAAVAEEGYEVVGTESFKGIDLN